MEFQSPSGVLILNLVTSIASGRLIFYYLKYDRTSSIAFFRYQDWSKQQQQQKILSE